MCVYGGYICLYVPYFIGFGFLRKDYSLKNGFSKVPNLASIVNMVIYVSRRGSGESVLARVNLLFTARDPHKMVMI